MYLCVHARVNQQAVFGQIHQRGQCSALCWQRRRQGSLWTCKDVGVGMRHKVAEATEWREVWKSENELCSTFSIPEEGVFFLPRSYEQCLWCSQAHTTSAKPVQNFTSSLYWKQSTVHRCLKQWNAIFISFVIFAWAYWFIYPVASPYLESTHGRV